MAGGSHSRAAPESLRVCFREAADHPLLDREGEQVHGRRLQTATREIERLTVEVPLAARHLVESWTRHRSDGGGARAFARSPGVSSSDIEAAVSRVADALARVDAAGRETRRGPARRRLARALRAAELRFERVQEAALHVQAHGRALEAAQGRRDRGSVRRLAREFGMPVRRIRRQLRALEDAIRRRDSARSALVLHNLRLVGHQARSLANRGVPFGDLVQEGTLGLMRAAEKFDPELGYRFSTYASWWIQQALTRAVQRQGRTVRLPYHVHDRLRRLRNLEAELRRREGREPAVEELAEATGLPEPLVSTALEQSRPVESLDGEEGPAGRPLLDRLGHEADPSAAPDQRRLVREVDRALESLPEQDAELVRLRFGVGREDPKTFDEIGRVQGMSRERTRKREKVALARMKEILGESRLAREWTELE